MNILFVCKWNKFRSKTAEAIFNKLYSNKHRVKSAGLFPNAKLSKEYLKGINLSAKRFGLKLSNTNKGLSWPLIMWADLTIVVADDVPMSIFKDFQKNDGKKIIHWKIKDVFGKSVEKREEVIKQLKNKVENLKLK